MTTWLPVARAPQYEISDHGAVRRDGRILKPTPNDSGHLRVSLSTRGRNSSAYVHHLVAEAFIGPRPVGMKVCHNDGSPGNNAASNLRYDTQAENIRDQVRHGVHRNARKQRCHKGHPFDGVNTWVSPDGSRRRCRACDYERKAA